MTEERCDCCDLPMYSCGREIERKQRQAERDELKALIDSVEVQTNE